MSCHMSCHMSCYMSSSFKSYVMSYIMSYVTSVLRCPNILRSLLSISTNLAIPFSLFKFWWWYCVRLYLLLECSPYKVYPSSFALPVAQSVCMINGRISNIQNIQDGERPAWHGPWQNCPQKGSGWWWWRRWRRSCRQNDKEDWLFRKTLGCSGNCFVWEKTAFVSWLLIYRPCTQATCTQARIMFDS